MQETLNYGNQSKQASRDEAPLKQVSSAQDLSSPPTVRATAGALYNPGWLSRIESAATATAAIRTLTAAVLAVMTITASHHDAQHVVAGELSSQSSGDTRGPACLIVYSTSIFPNTRWVHVSLQSYPMHAVPRYCTSLPSSLKRDQSIR